MAYIVILKHFLAGSRQSWYNAYIHRLCRKNPIMTEESESPSEPARGRAAGRARRAQKAVARQCFFDALASGYTVEQIAATSNVSIKTVRREIDRALDARRLDAPERYIHLQVERLTKALRLVDFRIERGELAAVGPLMKVVAALDRYHGLKDPPKPAADAPLAIPPAPPPPLALTHAAPPIDAASIEQSEDVNCAD
jgi:AraC-like DNA-binding protein